jgi:hypothetical protein
MKRILLIATLIFISCAVAPARSSREGARAEARVSTPPRTGINLRFGKNTTPRPVVGESAGVGVGGR